MIVVDVYDSTTDIFGDEQYVDHMRFVFEDSNKALDFIDEVVNEHHKAVVVSVQPLAMGE